MYRAIARYLSHATPAHRCLLAGALCGPFFMAYLVMHAWGLGQPAIRQALHVPLLWAVQGQLVLALVVTAAISVWLWPRRHDPQRQPVAEVLTTLNIGLTYTAIPLVSGVFSSGGILVLVGILAIGLMLFERRTMVIAVLACTAAMIAYDLALGLGWVRYAPVFKPEAFTGREPVWWLRTWQSVVFYIGMSALVPLVLLLFNSLDTLHDKLNRMSVTDPLTGLLNRRHFMERLNAEVTRQQHTGRPLSLVLIDADHFKRINDTHGHQVGDRVLRGLAQRLQMGVRTPTDLVARLGGEEFALLLPDTELGDAQAVCERIQRGLAQQYLQADGFQLPLTVSMGVVQSLGQASQLILRLADTQLYKAKNSGRNRVEFSHAPQAECAEAEA